MVDHIRTLLLNPTGVSGYKHVKDEPADTALALFGLSGSGTDEDADRVDALLPLTEGDDLKPFRAFFDERKTPRVSISIYRVPESSLSPDGLYASVLSRDGWWRIAGLFQSADPAVSEILAGMRKAASCWDAPFALGAVLIACAYRRLLLQEGVS